MFYCPFCQKAYIHNGAWLRKHVQSCSLSSSDCKPDVKSKIVCSVCRREFVSTKTLETHFHQFHPDKIGQINQCSQTDDSVHPNNRHNLLNQSIATEHANQITPIETTQSNEQVKKSSIKFFVGLIVGLTAGLVIGLFANQLIPINFFDNLCDVVEFDIMETIFNSIIWILKYLNIIFGYLLLSMYPIIGVAISALGWIRDLI